MTQTYPEISFPIPHPASPPPLIKNTILSRAAAIFDIPFIVELICNHLTSKEIWTCYRVNTAWRELFGIYRYQNVRFANLNSEQTWDILENACRIRTLEIDIQEGRLFLDNPAVLSWPSHKARSKPECINLQELTCVDLQYSCKCIPGYAHSRSCSPSIDPNYISALDLIHQNPMLQRLKVDSIRFETSRGRVFNEQILRSLSGMCFLTHLCIKVSAPVSKILENLPVSLQELEVVSVGRDDSFEEFSTRAINLRRLSSRGLSSRLILFILNLFSSLEDVDLWMSNSAEEEDVKSALITNCPRIHSIRFARRLNSDFSTLVNAYPNGLRVLDCGLSHDPIESTLTMNALLNHSLRTLEILRLDCHLRKVRVQVGTLLRSCSNLKVLDIRSKSYDTDKGVALWDILFDKNSASYPFRHIASNPTETINIPTHTPWACRNLEELHLTISDTSGRLKNSSFEEKQIWTARLIGQLYQELRSLKQLTKPHLNWMCRKNDLGDKLICELGLKTMVQYGQPIQYRMSREDLQWMNIRWITMEEFEESRRQEQVRYVADMERKRRNQSRKQCYELPPISLQRYCDYCACLHDDEWDEIDEWPSPVDRKKQFKTGKQYCRRSLKNAPSKKS
ncbi:hypothetical protein BGZ49_001407 [Haplosporangium sp. Z 27]|nr:hypothetical protein BGZ49_001407 [Haplosporangium sp. Z 27]